MTPPEPGAETAPTPRRGSPGAIAARVALHAGVLVIAAACLAAYEHFRVEGSQTAAVVSLVAAAGFGFAPVRDVIRVGFRVEGRTLHLVHALGGLGLLALPAMGVVRGAPVLTESAMAPFAIMGAAQAVMHQNHPRNAAQAAALRRFAASLPEVSHLARPAELATPEGARGAVAALSDVLTKAQVLGQTELDADPGFRSAMARASTRVAAGLGLDAVDLALRRLAASPLTAAAVPTLRQQLASARRAIAGTPAR